MTEKFIHKPDGTFVLDSPFVVGKRVDHTRILERTGGVITKVHADIGIVEVDWGNGKPLSMFIGSLRPVEN